ncbi:MAG TPA: response regulator transcription factor [Polyangiaceae bacterium]|nr:response regulator transcription factor [Polyangiaceae bacterium]
MVTPLPFTLRSFTPNPAARLRRVLLVDPDPVFGRGALESLTKSGLGARWSTSCGEARLLMDELRPDLVLLDISIADGMHLLTESCATRGTLPVVVLTALEEEAAVLAALRAGATGYVFKRELSHSSPLGGPELRHDVLASLIEEALRGGAPLSRAVAGLVLRTFRGNPRARPGGRELTPREQTVLAMLARGKSYADVGSALGVSENTVRSHVRAIYEKLGVSSKTEAVVTALRLGLVELEHQ